MNPLCLVMNYRQRFNGYKEFCHEHVETKIDEFLKRSCN